MSPFDNSFGGAMFTIIPLLVTAGFVLVFVLVIVTFIKGISTWKYNNSQPVLKVPAKVVSKRTNISRRSSIDHDNLNHFDNYSSTDYYVTFEVESKDRMEFKVRGEDYGLLIEGDNGKLSFQGTRYLGYERNIETD